MPRACEIDADAARAINVPSSLVKWLQSLNGKSTLLIHLSTDQGKQTLTRRRKLKGDIRYSDVEICRVRNIWKF